VRVQVGEQVLLAAAIADDVVCASLQAVLTAVGQVKAASLRLL
jgi:hypothetical protein